MTSTSGLWSPAAAAARVDWAVKAEAVVAPSVAVGNFCLTAEQVQLLLKPHSETKACQQAPANKLLESKLPWGIHSRFGGDGGSHPSLASVILASPNEVHPLTSTHALDELSGVASAGVDAALADWQAKAGKENRALHYTERQQYDF